MIIKRKDEEIGREDPKAKRKGRDRCVWRERLRNRKKKGEKKGGGVDDKKVQKLWKMAL